MKLQPKNLKAISLLDGRNWEKTSIVSDYFSEFALIKYRIRVEVAYLIFLSQKTKLVRKLGEDEIEMLENLWKKFEIQDALRVKEIEEKINHDVKAVEYFIVEKIKESTVSDIANFVHFGLTSYDINIPSYALMISEFRRDVLISVINKLLMSLKELVLKTAEMVMLARTHGQPALPTTMGKELAVFYKRIKNELNILATTPIEAKLTGAVGNFNALTFIDPDTDWIVLSFDFIKSLGLTPNIITTQIIPYDSWLRLFDSLKRLNNILAGFCQDMWWYISFDYFLQKKKREEVGSSTMSHKINPITFENAEGNLGFANSMLEFFVRKLSYSRLQRDLSDSTVKRDFGLAFGFSILAYDSILSGLSRITANENKMEVELAAHFEVFAEGIQTYLRLKGFKNAFELLKEETRGKVLSKREIHELIDKLPIDNKHKKLLKINNLKKYSGYAARLAKLAVEN